MPVFVGVIVIAALALQFHWNVKNFNESKRLLTNEIQKTFDKSVEAYYAGEVRSRFFNGGVRRPPLAPGLRVEKFARILHRKNTNSGDKNAGDTIIIRAAGGSGRVRQLPDLEEFADKIFISMSTDSVDIKKIDSVFKSELARKNLSLAYSLHDRSKGGEKEKIPGSRIHTRSGSLYLPPGSRLTLSYDEPTSLILQRNITEIALSLVFSLSLIGCLLFLLAIINKQKKIDQIKNDLISNITHEFKTPITTISSALEGMRSFNVLDDMEKTTRYLDISAGQLDKLGTMVEKLLETATLDTDALELSKAPVDISAVLATIVEKQKMISDTKNITLDAEADVVAQVDAFHFENAVSNIIDNAVKYGGPNIVVRLGRTESGIQISVSDDGPGIERPFREKIFDNFFRVPKGNLHDVKGFGIGLFYAKKILEKHGGTLELMDSQPTTFLMRLPYA